MADQRKAVRIGVIGCGAVAGYGHLPAIVQTPGLELVSVCDVNPTRAREVKDRFGAREWFTDAGEFMRSGLDVVSITSPLPLHAEHVELAAESGLHVLCEKPLAMNEAEGRRMIEAMERAGKLLMVGFTYRFSPAARTIKRLIEEGRIGEARSLRLIYVWDCHGRYTKRDDPSSGLQARRQGRMDEGGPMVDCGVHQIDLARWWLGAEVIGQESSGAWVEDHRWPDHVYLHLRHEGGAHTTVEISYSFGHTAAEPVSEFVYDIVGTDGLIRYNRNAKLFEVRTPAGTESIPFAGEKAFEEMYRCLAEGLSQRPAVRGDLPSGEDGLIATRLAVRATEEARARYAVGVR